MNSKQSVLIRFQKEFPLQAATIKLFLVQGNPHGLRTAELSNWSGKAIAAPRTEMAALLKRDELANASVYLLTGVDPNTGERAIYIGETTRATKRFSEHADKDFWNAVTLFVSKDENLTKTHVQYLEGTLIEKAKNSDGLIIHNVKNSGAKLPESDIAEMDIFLEKCLQLLPVLGISDFEEKPNKTSNEQDLLYCTIKGLTATGKRTDNGFIVFAGSQAVLEHLPSAQTIQIKRDELINKGLLRKETDHLVFEKDIEFGSPSTAGGVVRGGNTNGLTSWKNTKGMVLKDIEASDGQNAYLT
jgi:hypothetical protein